MRSLTHEEKFWAGEFGNEYILRNPIGLWRKQIMGLCTIGVRLFLKMI